MKSLHASFVALAVSGLAWSPSVFAAPPAASHAAARGATALRPPPSKPVTPKKTLAKQPPPSLKPKLAPKPPCLHESVQVTRGTEQETFPLTRCDGSAAPAAVEHLSILARPGSAARPETPLTDLVKGKGPNVAPGIKRVDAKLLERLQTIVDHFATHARTVASEKPEKGADKGAKKGEEPSKLARLQVISGYRPSSVGSYHASGRALDVRLEGISNEALVAFCKTLPDTGCGYYPNSSFIHIDVRDPGTGHVAWIDASGPGESPRYVATWPPPAMPTEKSAVTDDGLAKLDKSLQPLPVDEHPAEPTKEPTKEATKEVEPEEATEKKTASADPPTATEDTPSGSTVVATPKPLVPHKADKN